VRLLWPRATAATAPADATPVMNPEDSDDDLNWEKLDQRSRKQARTKPPAGRPPRATPSREQTPVDPAREALEPSTEDAIWVDEPSEPGQPSPPAASIVHRSRLPRKTPPSSAARTAGPSSEATHPSEILIGLGLLCIAVFAVLNLGGGARTSPTTYVSPPTSPPSASTPTTPPTTTQPLHTTPRGGGGGGPPATPHPVPKLWGPKSVLFGINLSYSLDSDPPSRDTPQGFSVTRVYGVPGESLTSEQSGGIAQAQGGGTPSRRQCLDALASGGAHDVQLSSPGIWMCAQTIAGHVARIRYQGGSPYAGYRFLITVWVH
jgi:hypothetical protein